MLAALRQMTNAWFAISIYAIMVSVFNTGIIDLYPAIIMAILSFVLGLILAILEGR